MIGGRWRAEKPRPAPRLASLVVAAAAVALVSGGWSAPPLATAFDRRFHDALFRLRPPPDAASPVALVALRAGATHRSRHSLRGELAALLELLAALPRQERPAAVLVDIALDGPHDAPHDAPEDVPKDGTTAPSPSADARIARAQATLGNVVHSVVFALGATDYQDPDLPMGALAGSAIRSPSGAARQAVGVVVLPGGGGSELGATAAALGHINLARGAGGSLDTSGVPLLIRYGGGGDPGGHAPPPAYLPSLALAGALLALCEGRPFTECVTLRPHAIAIQGAHAREIPLDPDRPGFYPVNFRRRFLAEIPSHDLGPLAGAAGPGLAHPPEPAGKGDVFLLAMADPPRLLSPAGAPAARGELAGRLLVVVSAEEPRIPTALGTASLLGTLHAHAAANLLQDDPLRIPTARAALLMTLALTFVAWGAMRPSVRQRIIGRLAHRAPRLFAAWEILSSGEVVVGVAWTLIAGLALVLGSTALPLAQPLAALTGSWAGWRWARTLLAEAALRQVRAAKAEVEASHRALEAALAAARGPAVSEATPAAPPHAAPSTATADATARVAAAQIREAEALAQARAISGIEARLIAAERGVEEATWALEALLPLKRELSPVAEVGWDLGPVGDGIDEEVAERTGIATRYLGLAALLKRLIRVYVQSLAPIAVSGVTGTGKNMLVRKLHARSGVRGPFVEINCATLDGSLILSTLFGHKKGAFTGAVSDQAGLFAEAHKGTLFLDEVGALPLATQALLLTVIETGRYSRVGETGVERAVQVRIIVASEDPIEDLVRRGTFRRDLYYRLKGSSFRLPTLAERPADLPHLIAAAGEAALKGAPAPVRFTDAALDALGAHPWPGGLRELSRTVESLVAQRDGDEIGADEVRRHLWGDAADARGRLGARPASGDVGDPVAPRSSAPRVSPDPVSPDPATSARRPPHWPFSPEGMALLSELRAAHFVLTALRGSSASGGGSDASISDRKDLVLAESLIGSQHSQSAALDLLAGPDATPAARNEASKQLTRFIKRCEKWATAPPDGPGNIEEMLRKRYGARNGLVLQVVEAARQGRITR